MNRSRYMVELARGQLSPSTSGALDKSDNGYESSPAPSLDFSIDMGSDDSIKDPYYFPSESDADDSSIERIEYLSDLDAYTSRETPINNDNQKDVSSKQDDNFLSGNEINVFQNIVTEQTSQRSVQPLSKSKKRKKTTVCKYCATVVTNFERHLERNHSDCKEVREMLSFPKKHIERKKIISLIRYSGHFQEYLNGNLNPKYGTAQNQNEYYPCSQCKALLKRKYLSRHTKNCILKEHNSNTSKLAMSQTLIACSLDQNNILNKLRIKHEVFQRMKADDISMIAKTDMLITAFGENYLKRHRRIQIATACSNKMRELARFLKELREMTKNSNYRLQDILKPNLFDTAVESAKRLGGYDSKTKTYRAPSLSAHIGTSLTQVCDLFMRLILKQDQSIGDVSDKEETLKETTRFRDLIVSQWSIEISSLAFKDLHEKKWKKPVLLPLTNDIKKFKEYITEVADKAVVALKTDPLNKKEFKNLTECSLILTILFNRKRSGDVQYTQLATYTNNIHFVNQIECENALSESEKVLTKYYKRIVTGGKGSKPVAILFPPNLQSYIDFLMSIRTKTTIVPENNLYLFGNPGNTKWIRGDVIIRKFAANAKLDDPQQISSNKLRKQIATVMQILNLSKEESEQFAQFMGHTEKTHNEFYKLPQDVYQTAKISKLLLLMEKGVDIYKGKSLKEIDIDPHSQYAEEQSDVEELTPGVETNILISCQDEQFKEQNLVTKSKKIGRTRWTKQQMDLVRIQFKKHIDSKRAPNKKECLKVLTVYPETLHDKNWIRLKTCVYNIYRGK